MLAIVLVSLGGCLGGSVAQQLASSLAVHAADQMTASIVENHDLQAEAARRKIVLKDSPPDPYWAAFVTSGFTSVKPITEPIPNQNAASPPANAAIQATPLVRVEIWNLLIGQEKLDFLEKARLQGSPNLPPKNQWPLWQVATGALTSDKHKPVVFLIPPGFGRVASGEMAVVEMSTAGEPYFARYAVN